MVTDNSKTWEQAKVEYETGLRQFQHNSTLRRQDMAFVTTVQAAVLTIVGSKLLRLDLASLLLSLIAFFVLLLGFNSERRLSTYMEGYLSRAKQIESENGMSIFSDAWNQLQSKKLLFSNAKVFPIYYWIFILVWLIIWGWNLWNRP